MPADYVKPDIKRGKNDEVDAEMICEAVDQADDAVVPIKNSGQQAILKLLPTRDLFVHQDTMLVSSRHGQLAEFGLFAPQGI